MATYVDRDDEIVYRPPYLQKDAFLSSFIVGSPREKQQAILDTQLNNLCNRKPFYYRAVVDSAALVLADIGQVRSLDPRDKTRGWVSEVDVCWWILAAAEKDGKLDHLAWFIPYIWVDNPYTMVNGRESFGFPKSFAWSRIPKSQSDLDGTFWADALVLPSYTPETEVSRQRILEVTLGPHDPITEIVDGVEAFARVLESVFKHPIQDAVLAAKMMAEALSGKMPVVYLKQFRDIVNAEAACYQAIVESNTTVHGFHGAGLLPFGFTVKTFPMASVDVAKFLGFDTTTNVDIAMWAKLDFSVDLGREIWRAQ
jgi:hypothetical protein